jgi:SAM domain (Sterile alpha motif)
MDVVVWLRSLGLGQYEAAFRENEVDDRILPKLTVAEPRVPHILVSLWREEGGCKDFVYHSQQCCCEG